MVVVSAYAIPGILKPTVSVRKSDVSVMGAVALPGTPLNGIKEARHPVRSTSAPACFRWPKP